MDKQGFIVGYFAQFNKSPPSGKPSRAGQTLLILGSENDPQACACFAL
jgi:hypothetical protein